MAYQKRNGNNVTWVLEESDGDIPARLNELAQIFSYYANNKSASLSPNFVAEIAEVQTRAIIRMAHEQERELKRLRQMEKDIDELKREMAELKSPGYAKLDKPAAKKPQAGTGGPKN
ncbi:MAG: hypothetical protein GC185_07800 [Alphaproteobacteria bacterium]|nr:hypothetical protein [Alphaproteobacteria bacterium]